jgi:DNA helicase-2/ATP-dependent DNA helicase PcrA
MPDNTAAIESVLSRLNPQQRLAAMHGDGPLLIVAGAGTGKTATLVHRVAWLIAGGVDPGRILLLTFTRRAAAEMIRRVDGILAELHVAQAASGQPVRGSRIWGGTFHAIATRLLRRYGKAIGLQADFTIHDRSDSEDLMNVVRAELNLAKNDRRFPRKATCMAIYSRLVNARQKLREALDESFPWCKEWHDELGRLFSGYVDRKEGSQTLDYDDLLLYWHALLADEQAGPVVCKQFDCVLVDEYQDTNALQADLLYLLSPEGKGLTVVGDDAQSIYAFRAATVRNILDFPKQYPNATIIPLEQNYRSSQPILDASNAVISQARERFTKNLWTPRTEGQRPRLVTCTNEDDQADYVVRRVLEHREAGVDLRRQSVLFRASHHSIVLEAELSRRGIPFHKYGGLKFIEAAHIKDLMAILRLAENRRDVVSGLRVLALLPGIGPKKAHQLMERLADSAKGFEEWKAWNPPAASEKLWPKLVELLAGLAVSKEDLPTQVHQARTFYSPLLETLYDNPKPRARDLEQLEQVAARFTDRQSMLAELTLDPPASTQDLAGPPILDDDYLVLSTIHSAKGLEWEVVYVIHASDGNIPSDMSTGSDEQIEEERRLFYVAITRAKNHLYVAFPMAYYHHPGTSSDRYGLAQLTRFLAWGPEQHFDRVVSTADTPGDEAEGCLDISPTTTSESIRRRSKDLWS